MSSKYWIRSLIGLVICGAAIVAIDNGIYHLIRTGSCGSDGTYVAVRPCPPGTGLHIMSLIFGVFAGLIGVGVYATRGDGGRPSPLPLGLIMWSLLFVTLAVSIAVAAFGPANNDNSGAQTAAIVIGVIFLPMGLAPLPFAVAGRGKTQQLKKLASAGVRCTGVVTNVEDTGVTVNDNPHVKITVRAEPRGEPPFTVVKQATVSRVRIPRIGDGVVVFYDPANREGSNGITFDQVPAVSPGAPAVSVGAPAPNPEPEEDAERLDLIAKLGELRDKGLITPSEFEEKKQRLLKEL